MDSTFCATTGVQCDRMTKIVQREIAVGDTTPLDDVFPSLVSKPGNQALPKAFENSSSHSRRRFRSEKSSCQESTSAEAIIMAV